MTFDPVVTAGALLDAIVVAVVFLIGILWVSWKGSTIMRGRHIRRGHETARH